MPQYVRGLDEIFSLRLEKPKLYPWVAKEVLTLLFIWKCAKDLITYPKAKRSLQQLQKTFCLSCCRGILSEQLSTMFQQLRCGYTQAWWVQLALRRLV